jgi:hypothetical protein
MVERMKGWLAEGTDVLGIHSAQYIDYHRTGMIAGAPAAILG